MGVINVPGWFDSVPGHHSKYKNERENNVGTVKATSGFAGWLLRASVHIYFLIGFGNRLFVLLQWDLDFLKKRRRVRVLSEESPSAENLIDPAA